jgi:hypothetical protein
LILVALSSPPPLLLARELAPLLTDLNWGIGGSLLLYHLKLVAIPRDLDIVTTPEDFPELQKRLTAFLSAPVQIGHPTYASTHFSRFTSQHGVNLDVMAGIRVRTSTRFKSWEFDPHTISVENELPWMQAQDWLELYELFDRSERATVLRDYLSIARRRP